MKRYLLTEDQLKDLMDIEMVSYNLVDRTRDDIDEQHNQIIDEILNSRQWVHTMIDRKRYDEPIK